MNERRATSAATAKLDGPATSTPSLGWKSQTCGGKSSLPCAEAVLHQGGRRSPRKQLQNRYMQFVWVFRKVRDALAKTLSRRATDKAGKFCEVLHDFLVTHRAGVRRRKDGLRKAGRTNLKPTNAKATSKGIRK